MSKRAYLKGFGIKKINDMIDAKKSESFDDENFESDPGARPAKITAWQNIKSSKTASTLWKYFVTNWGHDPLATKKRR